jgi:bifunctional UDP-N-acetylglucosamine pyrophosphorylase / glucosamine-1-phosphate N-acetyltransferase
MVSYVLDAAAQDTVKATVVVVGHGATWVEKSLSDRARKETNLAFAEQAEQLGTGHAVSVALPLIEAELGETDGHVLILPGDTPLLRHNTISELLEAHENSGAALTVLTAFVEDPTGYGRIVRDKNNVVSRIVEEKDANAEQRAIREINTSIMVVRQSVLGPALRRVDRQNAQNEYYLTDLIGVLHDAGHDVQSFVLSDPGEASGVNDRLQLAQAEQILRKRINEKWMQRGVTMWDPTQTYVDADVVLEPDATLLPGTVLKGHCFVDQGASIGPNALLTDVSVGKNADVGGVVATNATIGANASVASFVVLLPGAEVAEGEHIEPFHTRP